ncbi:AGE family epimerase/isomerase [Sphaerochaeta associata]|uniref:AGE family epimerase/isomerase n=1 Tax=Sphaerochaeta associata TaxID=1129264 RepID=A0ABY4DC45_9SPIR|nr:AGE family epimerase/isomerase [Sphaerochaeta associata]UOM51614.1 AGE family epimerase/isomerase [Sphaerochaeta associata]
MKQTSDLLYQEYRHMLVDNILPFWLRYGLDRVHGGMYTALDRDGSILDTDKSVWFQGRALWTYATAYRQVEKNAEFKTACDSLVSFIEKHCFDPADGRMFFRVSKEGRPEIKRIRYVFSETFAILGFAAYSRAFNRPDYAQKAYDLLLKVEGYLNTPGVLVPKFETASIGFGLPMILLNTVQELRAALPDRVVEFNARIDGYLEQIKTHFVRPELQIVVEQCNPDGSLQLDHFEGRQLNPGHAIEGAWFILNEARYRNNDPDLMNLGTTMLDWMWSKGWDAEMGGIIYFRDALGRSATEYWHDMKFWWPQCEATIANLMAYSMTGKESYLTQFDTVHQYIKGHFIDREFGEWYGYLHRDGSLSTPLKGNMYKGPFHIPRMYLVCCQLLDELRR